MSEALLSMRKVTMRYGKTVALNELSLEVNKGDIYGLIGPNGAGKTTAFRIVATVLRPTGGEVSVAGMSIGEACSIRNIRRKIGYMPDSFGVYEDMTVEEYLSFFAAAYDIVNPRRQKLVDDVLSLVDLVTKRDALIETLSRGMQQRLGIARVLIHDPELLILDEPASGLDPRARIEIRSLLQELQSMGKTILISSHILADLGEVCNRVGIIEKGKLLVDGPLDEVVKRVRPSGVAMVRVNDAAAAEGVLKALAFVREVTVQKDTLVITMSDGADETWRIADALVKAGIRVSQIEPESDGLERAFIELTEGTVS